VQSVTQEAPKLSDAVVVGVCMAQELKPRKTGEGYITSEAELRR